jgi:UDP-N-acetylglucosamine 4-epimerase
MKVLITCGAGFIRSNIINSFLLNSNFTLVRVLDNFETGYFKNIDEFVGNLKFESIEGRCLKS